MLEKTDFVFEQVASALGIMPNFSIVITPVIICVEGSNDVHFLIHISKVLHKKEQSFPDINSDPRITVLPLGGSSLAEWVKHRYLKNLGAIEIHIYDRDYEPPAEPEYLFSANSVNQKQDGSVAFITSKM
ncbi:hypothetical protein [Paenibacillus sp. PastF-3]|uniref:hypothetical protein n=1 Tax=Paenibacillus sp. PastF-3 TaxID=2940626 RepID=UPI00247336E1|nr:hypothetical protein [Paenibacillus sp. PastF-3]